MKRIVACRVLACVAALGLSIGVAQAARPRIGLSLPTQREERWVRDKQAMEAEAKRLGVDLRVQVTDNDAARQVAQCENLISQGITVLILAPHDASSASVIVDKAAEAGIKVISYDRLVMDSPRDYYYLSFDNVKVGELQGEFLTKTVKKGNIVVLAGSPTDNNAKLFREGAMKFIKPLVDKGDLQDRHGPVRQGLAAGRGAEAHASRRSPPTATRSTPCWRPTTAPPAAASRRSRRSTWRARCRSPGRTPSSPGPSASCRARRA